MKKFIGMITAVSVIFGMLAVKAEDTSETLKNDAVLEKAVSVLEYIGAFSAPADGVISEESMSRAEFASITARALGENGDNKSNIYFADAGSDNPYAPYINALTERGCISTQSRYFRPDDAITYAEAAKILACASGYDVYANINGGYPMGYINAAERLEWLKNCQNPDALNKREALKMIFNAFNTGIYEPTSMNGNGAADYRESEQTLFSIYNDVYTGKAVLTACTTASFDENFVRSGEVKLDNETYILAEDIYPDSMFLNNVEFAYHKTNDDDKTVFYMSNVESKNHDIYVSAENIRDFETTGFTLSWYSGNKTTSKNIKRSAVVYYNGSEYTGSITDIINGFVNEKRKGSIRLKDFDNDGVIETLIIKSYKNIVVNYIDSDKGIYYSMSNADENFVLSDYDSVLLNVSGGQSDGSVSLPAALSVAASADKRFAEAVICTEKVNGTIDEISKDGDAEIIRMGEKKFLADASYSSEFPKFIAGGSYNVTLDMFGYAAYSVTTYNSGYEIGLLISGSLDKEGTTRLLLKILDRKTGNVSVLKASEERLKIDGNSYKGEKDCARALRAIPGVEYNGAHAVEQQAVRYKLNDSGEISEIDTYNVGDKEDKDNTLTKLPAPFGFDRYFSRYSRMGTTALYNDSATAVFSKPRVDKDGYLLSDDNAGGYGRADDYVLDASGNRVHFDDTMYYNKINIRNEEWAQLDVYKFNPNTAYADIIVNTYESYFFSTDCLMFDTTATELDADGEPIEVIKCWKLGEKVTYEVETAALAAGLKRGDLFRCDFNYMTKQVKDITKVYDSETDTIINAGRTPGTTSSAYVETIVPDFWYSGNIVKNLTTNKVTNWGYYNAFQLSKGKVTNKLQNTIYWDWDGDYSTFEECCDFSNVPIMLVEKNGDKNDVRSATVSEIPDYKSAGGDCATMVFYSTYMSARCGYVYID